MKNKLLIIVFAILTLGMLSCIPVVTTGPFRYKMGTKPCYDACIAVHIECLPRYYYYGYDGPYYREPYNGPYYYHPYYHRHWRR